MKTMIHRTEFHVTERNIPLFDTGDFAIATTEPSIFGAET